MKLGTMVSCLGMLVAGQSVLAGEGETDLSSGNVYTNRIGMKMKRIEPGSFRMGFTGQRLSEEMTQPEGQFAKGDPDEHPAHKVTITRPFYIGVHEVTNKEYEMFEPAHQDRRGVAEGDKEAVVNVSWYDAQAFCRWLSDKEGRPYRLPTEAEWEYACRTGTSTPFWTGRMLPKRFVKEAEDSLEVGATGANAWGLFEMHGNVEEWCRDWYGPYEAGPQIDPVGRVTGDFKVTRGGSHSTNPYYLRSANRSGTLPEDEHDLIGFRVVMAAPPSGEPLPQPPAENYQKDVEQRRPKDIEKGPPPEKPYFQGPQRFVNIAENAEAPLFAEHNHFTSVVPCPNGDLLAIWHTCETESNRELAVAASRLPYGEDEWQPASLFWDAPDRNDHGHALWYDGDGTIYHFQGLADRVRNVALVVRTSPDSGKTWSRPRIIGDHGNSRMPVESVFRSQRGWYVISCDDGPNVVWISKDKGLTWEKQAGTIRGMHAPVAQLRDGRLFAFGRRGSINGKMPISISTDMGASWDYKPGRFQPISWGQRAILLRLHEGPLFFASFCKRMMMDQKGAGRHEASGLFGAVSYDDGKTWPDRRLITQSKANRMIETLDGDRIKMDAHHAEPVGYLTVCQTPDGLIHLLSSRQHYAFNLAWLRSEPPPAAKYPAPPKPRSLAAKAELSSSYSPKRMIDPETWGRRGAEGSEVMDVTGEQYLKIRTTGKQQFYMRNDRSDQFGAVEAKEGFTVEIRAKVEKRQPGNRGLDMELYDGAGNRYAVSITESGVYWYEGLVIGSALLEFDEFTPITEDLNNTEAMHTFRLAVRSDGVAQIYRDAKLLGVRRFEYRTPRSAYIQYGAGQGVRATVGYYAYDLSGAFRPVRISPGS